MFGSSKGATTEALEKLVQKGKWDKIKKSYLNSDSETKVHLAEACASAVGDDSSNVLMALLDSHRRWEPRTVKTVLSRETATP